VSSCFEGSPFLYGFFFASFVSFEMPLAPIALAFTLHAASQGMSKVFTLVLESSPRLAGLLCFYKCLLILCYTLVLSLLFLGVGFKFNLVSFWGCLRPISHAFVCFIRSFEPSRTRSNMLFIYRLIK
jgi:hypothetical protein